MKKIPLPACLPPWLISGCPDRWSLLIGQDEALNTYHNKMLEAQKQQSEAPVALGILPARPPDGYEVGPPARRSESGASARAESRSPEVCGPSDASSTTYGVVTLRSGETLSGIYGPAWDYVYNLEINRGFRSKFPDPNKVHEGAQIRHPCHLTRRNQALAEYERNPLEVPFLRSGVSTIKVPLNAAEGDVQNIMVSAPCSGAIQTDVFTESFPNLETSALPDCTGLIKSAKLSVKVTLFGSEDCPLRAENIDQLLKRQKGRKEGETGKEPKIGLEVDHWKVDVGCLGSLSVQDTKTGAKTEFGLVSGKRSIKSSGPKVEIGILCVEPVQNNRRGDGEQSGGEKCSVTAGIQPAVKYDESGRIELSIKFRYSAYIYEDHRTKPRAQLDVEIESSFVFDPKKVSPKLSCQPFSYRLDEKLEKLLKEFEHRGRAPEGSWEVGIILVLGVVVVVLLAPVVAVGAKAIAGASSVLTSAALTSFLHGLARAGDQGDPAANPVLVIPVKK
jgi:hypothetical protein